MHNFSYNERTTNNDVALLKLKKKIDFKKFSGTVAPICLPSKPRKYYGKTVTKVSLKECKTFTELQYLAIQQVTVPGWGRLTEGGESPKMLHEVDLKVTLYLPRQIS